MSALTLFGLFAVSAMLVFYALESRSHWFVLGFAASCVLGSIYGFLQGAWPFGLVEGVWSVVAFRRWLGIPQKAKPERLNPDYGFDGFPVRLMSACLIACAIGASLLAGCSATLKVLGAACLSAALLILYLMVKMLFYVHVGKLRLREHLLSMADLKGNEAVLDVGTGRGLLLIGAAKRLPHGKSCGIDIWSQVDMKGNNPADTLKNAELEGVLDRVEVRGEDARELSFPDGSFDVVLSNLCIHNIPTRAGREKACQEIARVLKPGGVAVISDILHLDEYSRVFIEANMTAKTERTRFLENTTPWHRILIARKSGLN
jgi:ubiquinone/menaquinone biosynthesis C-methylase UbiE